MFRIRSCILTGLLVFLVHISYTSASGYTWNTESVDTIDAFEWVRPYRDSVDQVHFIGNRMGLARLNPVGDDYETEHVAGIDAQGRLTDLIQSGEKWFAISSSPTGALDLIIVEGQGYSVLDLHQDGVTPGEAKICPLGSGELAVVFRDTRSGMLLARFVTPGDPSMTSLILDDDGSCGNSIGIIPFSDNGFRVFYHVGYPYFDLRMLIFDGDSIYKETMRSLGDAGQSIQATVDGAGHAHLKFFDGWDQTTYYATDAPDSVFRFYPVFDLWDDTESVLMLDEQTIPHFVFSSGNELKDRSFDGTQWSERVLFETETSVWLNNPSGFIKNQDAWELAFLEEDWSQSNQHDRYPIRWVTHADGQTQTRQIKYCTDPRNDHSYWGYGVSNQVSIARDKETYFAILPCEQSLVVWDNQETWWTKRVFPHSQRWSNEIETKAIANENGLFVITRKNNYDEFFRIQDRTIARHDVFINGSIKDMEFDPEGDPWVIYYNRSEQHIIVGEFKDNEWRLVAVPNLQIGDPPAIDLEFDIDQTLCFWAPSDLHTAFFVRYRPPDFLVEGVIAQNDIADLLLVTDLDISAEGEISAAGYDSGYVIVEKARSGWAFHRQISSEDRDVEEFVHWHSEDTGWQGITHFSSMDSAGHYDQMFRFDRAHFVTETVVPEGVTTSSSPRFWELELPCENQPILAFSRSAYGFAFAIGTPEYPQMHLEMTDRNLSSGDIFHLERVVRNGEAPAVYLTACLLEIQVGDSSLFYSWPGWNPIDERITFGTVDLGASEETRETLIEFVWPDSIPVLTECAFWSALFSSDFSGLAADLSRLTWRSN